MESRLIWNDPVNGYDEYFTEDSYKKLVKEETFEHKLSTSIASIKLQRQSNHIVIGNKGKKSALIGEIKGSNSAVNQELGSFNEDKPVIKVEVKSEPGIDSLDDFVLPTSSQARKNNGLQKKSSLTRNEQRKYIDLLLKYRLHPPGPNLSNTEKKDLKSFEALQVRVAAEQNEFIGKLRELAPNQGIYNFLSPDGRRYLEEKHEEKLKQVEDLPRYFVTINKPVPLNVTVNPGSPPPNLVFIKTLVELGVPAKINIPTICNNEKKMIPNDYEKVSSQCPTFIQSVPENRYCKQVCSKDKNSEMLACKTYSHIVLSTSVIRCLINNHAPNFNTAWEIPVTVKTHELQYQGQTIKQKVVYFDKPLPSKEQSNRDKNTKYHKYALRAFLARSQNKMNIKNKPNTAVPDKKSKPLQQKSVVKDEDPFGDVSIDDIETFGTSTLTSKPKENLKLQNCDVIKTESRVKRESSSMSEMNKDLFGSGSETDTPCDKTESSIVLETSSGADCIESVVSDANKQNESSSEISDSDVTDKECQKNSDLSVSQDREEKGNSVSSQLQEVDKSHSDMSSDGSNIHCPVVSSNVMENLTSDFHDEIRSDVLQNDNEPESKIVESDSEKVSESVIDTGSRKLSPESKHEDKGQEISESDLKISSVSNVDSVSKVPNILGSSTDSEAEENLVIDLGDFESQVKKRKIEQICSPKENRDKHFLCNPKPSKIVDISRKDKNVPNRVPFAIFKQKWKLRPLTSDDHDQISPVKDQNVVRLRSGKIVGNHSSDESSSSFSQSDSECVFTPPKKPRVMEDITSLDNLSQSDCDDEVPVKVIPLEKQEYGQLMMIPKCKNKEKSTADDNNTPGKRVLRSQSRCSESHDQNDPIEMDSLSDEQFTSASRERRRSPRIHRSSSDVDLTKDTDKKPVETLESTVGGDVVKRKRGRPRKEAIKIDLNLPSNNTEGDKVLCDKKSGDKQSVRRSLSVEKQKCETKSNTNEDVTELYNNAPENKSDVRKDERKDDTVNSKNKAKSTGTLDTTGRKTNKTTKTNLLDDILGKPDPDSEKKKEGQGEYLEPVNGQISYHLWKFSGLSVIIRTSTHGMVRDARQSFQGHIVPKLEYQIKHGVEQISLEEVSQAWISCYVKPFSQLLRGRISASTSELLMIETLDLNQILSQATNFNVIGALCSLHNILMTVYSLENGRYLLCHESGEPHCHIKQSTQNKRGAYDLHFSHQGHTNMNEKNNPWYPIDTNIILPHHKIQGRIPATYEPEDFNTANISNKRKGGKKKKWNNKK